MSFNPEDRLKDFPCNFNLTTGHKVSHQRLKHIKDKVIEDLECSDSSIEEKIRDLNLLTWTLFCLDEKDEALEKINKVLERTKRKNITSLGNLIYISCRMGDKIKASQIYKELLDLKQLDEFEELRTTAVAEQAYSCSRLGGHENYILSRDLFRECISQFPENYLWKYGFGLACKRLTNWNIQCTNRESIDFDLMRSDGVKTLFDVAENGDTYLKGLAYAQLVNLRQYYKDPKYDLLFNRHSIQHLCTKSLEFGENDPAVLTQCGKSLKSFDLDRSICLLRKSISLRESTIAYHHLGVSLLIKAKNEAIPNRSLSGKSPNSSPRRTNLGGRGFSADRSRKTTTFHRNDKLVREAIECFQKAIKISHGENVPAIASLGDAYRTVKDFQSALAQYNQIIDQKGSKFNGVLRNAHTAAGECLHHISKDLHDSRDLVNEAKEHYIKAISITADLISRKPECEDDRYMWSALDYICLRESQLPLKKGKSRIFELVKSYKDNAGVLKLMLDQALGFEDFGKIKKELNTFLDNGDYEDALAFINIADTALARSDNRSSPDVKEMRSRVYFTALWFRLMKGSADSTRVFQQMFHLRYGQCVGMVSEDESEDAQTKYCDVVIFAGDRTSKLAKTLCEIFKLVYGVETVYRSKSSVDKSDQYKDEMCGLLETCSLFVVVLDEDDDVDFEKIKRTEDNCTDVNILLINWGPDRLDRYASLDLNDDFWKPAKLLMTSMENTDSLTRKYVIEKLFQGNHEAVIRMFCFLVGEDFDRRREDWFTSR